MRLVILIYRISIFLSVTADLFMTNPTQQKQYVLLCLDRQIFPNTVRNYFQYNQKQFQFFLLLLITDGSDLTYRLCAPQAVDDIEICELLLTNSSYAKSRYGFNVSRCSACSEEFCNDSPAHLRLVQAFFQNMFSLWQWINIFFNPRII